MKFTKLLKAFRVFIRLASKKSKMCSTFESSAIPTFLVITYTTGIITLIRP
ncbi:Uncharacterized protein APZ42_018687 [Daphnia magna]|uniref:Uncharacterized protein n=1 Tax=Daphnia magna TaxID=35525 RepID=A0A164YRK3_9CRUS|nr:Uncharacterized protein APZ42_018687 [Daphnia magna]